MLDSRCVAQSCFSGHPETGWVRRQARNARASDLQQALKGSHMRLDRATQEYLHGRVFANAHHFRITREEIAPRNQLLVHLASGKRVLHVGCADHVELIKQKRANGTYLHDLLAEVATELTGLDTNAAAVSEMTELGIPDLFLPKDLPIGRTYDLVLAPDVIEHVPNVGVFLDGLRSFGAPVVVTTPNALRLQNRLLWRGELINTDHRYWFSPYTLAKSMIEAGYRVDRLWYTDSPTRLRRVRHALTRQFPVCSDGLAMLASPTRAHEA
jgi:2-polyprenyl-3-methyl-5-hydroxy-6-metoxy-1,4-benzoquinol methylase